MNNAALNVGLHVFFGICVFTLFGYIPSSGFAKSYGILRKSLVAQMVKNLPPVQETWVQFLGQEDPLEKGMATHSSILAWRIPIDRGTWQAAVHGVKKSQHMVFWGFPGGTTVRNPSANAGDIRDAGLIPGLGRSRGGGNDNLLQYSCLGNPVERGAWWDTVHEGCKRVGHNLSAKQ